MKTNELLAAIALTFLLFGCGQPVARQSPEATEGLPIPPGVEARIQNVENGLLRKSREGLPLYGEAMTLDERMAHYHVPGVSIAVINHFEIEWAKGYGVLEAGRGQPVTPDTLFQAASISKPVTAAAALSLVEKGLLDLDRDVNDQLDSWRVPENGFTEQEHVTLRRLLSHSAGVTVSGFRGYAQGEQIPTLRQVLEGASPANSAPIRVDMVPGTRWRYSGGGFTVVQQLLEDVTGKPFPAVLQETVLGPAGMGSSTFEQPLAEERRAVAATAHTARGQTVPGRWYTFPELAAAGLWTTPSDLARFAVEIMSSYAGESNRILSPDMVEQMLAPQSEVDDGTHMALGFFLQGEGKELLFFHGGGNAPGFLSGLIAFPERGQGAVIMTNGMRGGELAEEIRFSIGEEYGWPP